MLAEAASTDEVKQIRGEAEVMRAYAIQAKDRQLEINAAHIRFRAERRLGELIRAQRETIGLAKGGRPYQAGSTGRDVRPVERPPTLKEAGIDKDLSALAQRMAAMDEAEFERKLELHRAEFEAGKSRVTVDLSKVAAEAEGRERRRDLAQALSASSAALPTGRKYPVIYVDPPWHRNAGISDRSYENHYSTMSWSEICALPVAELLLPDAWLFMWIPRAHLLALHQVELEVAVAETGEVVRALVDMPLAWAVAKSWGLDSYSTCFVWTKTDEAHPNAAGSGLIARDQDELLLLFKRGQGLPKPAGDEKFGSNHRERPREHSRKPDFYRDMISTMSGGLPVLEMFARVDADHPLPPGWDGWGNQAQQETALVGDGTLPAGAVTACGAPSAGEMAAPGEDWPPTPGALIDLPPRFAHLPAFEATLSADEYLEWLALARLASGIEISRQDARDLIGSGYADTLGEDRLALTESGHKWLRSIEQHVERSERVAGRSIGVALATEPRQVDLEELIGEASQ